MPPKGELTWPQLAAGLEVSRKTLIQWRKRPDAPESRSLAVWKAYVKEAGLGIGGNKVGDTREALLEASVEKRNRLLDLQIAKEERKSVDRGEVDAMLLNVASLQKAVLYPALERELPAKGAGKSATELAVIGREIGDRICEILSGAIDSWKRA